MKTSNLQAHASDPKDHLMVWVVGFASFLRNHQREIAAKFWVTNTKRFESTDLELFLLTYVWDSTTHWFPRVFLVFFCCWPMGFLLDKKSSDRFVKRTPWKANGWYFVGWSFFSPDIFRFGRLVVPCPRRPYSAWPYPLQAGGDAEEIGDFCSKRFYLPGLLTWHLFQQGLEDDVPFNNRWRCTFPNASIPYVVAEW